ncbi:hypothetical protein [Phycobacter azelaicus]|jgi:hypothetical protein|uniref:hypothetical protein n=1 Tax=Phycobacter azelaicus TaxID=2668075 RepID=UPI001866A75D|nr:hypothetical protein [Phycobacter azelaicus]MBE1295253.1 hypothetical protein [Paracoccaceae bacterium]
MIRLSDIMETAPEINTFWALERCVSVAARSMTMPGLDDLGVLRGGSAAQTEPDRKLTFLNCDVVPEFRDTPRKWQLVLISAFERGQRARALNMGNR